MLQIISVASIGIVDTMKQGLVLATTRNSMVVLAVLSFAMSRLLVHFIYKNFRYHDYNHVWSNCFLSYPIQVVDEDFNSVVSK